jgi:acyl-CoA synthetase (AMP-forming)/AMP-acid ligase II
MKIGNREYTSYFEHLRAASRSNPSRILYVLINESGCLEISCGEFWKQIHSTALYLRSKGVGAGDVLLIFGQHGATLLQSFFAAQLLGAIPTFLPVPTSRQDGALWRESHRMLCKRLQPRLIIAEANWVQEIAQLTRSGVCSLSEIENAARIRPTEELTHECSAESIAFLQHSSGTTGLKKGVVVTYGQLAAQVASYSSILNLDREKHRIVSWLPIYHDMGLIAATLMPLSLAMPVTWIDTMTWLASPNLFIEQLSAAPNAVAWMPNFAFRYLAQRYHRSKGNARLDDVHAIVNCSEPCKIADMNKFVESFAPMGLRSTAVQVCYAMAEYVFAVTQSSLGQPVKSLAIDRAAFSTEGKIVPLASSSDSRSMSVVTVGKPIPGARIRISESIHGDVGEIEVSGPSLCCGYHKNIALTHQHFFDGWYRTGDFGFFYEGDLYVTGRRDDVIIVRGRNVYAHDVEEIVNSLERTKRGRCIAIGVDDSTGTQQMIIIAERSEATDAGAAPAIAEKVLESTGLSPREIIIVEPNTLVKTSSGKLSRVENAARYAAGRLVRWAAGSVVGG